MPLSSIFGLEPLLLHRIQKRKRQDIQIIYERTRTVNKKLASLLYSTTI